MLDAHRGSSGWTSSPTTMIRPRIKRNDLLPIREPLPNRFSIDRDESRQSRLIDRSRSGNRSPEKWEQAIFPQFLISPHVYMYVSKQRKYFSLD